MMTKHSKKITVRIRQARKTARSSWTQPQQKVKLAKLCLHKVIPLVSTNVECSQSLVMQCEGIEIWA